MKKYNILFFLFVMTMFSCQETASLSKASYPEDIENDILQRLEYIDNIIFKNDTTLQLTEPQRKALYPVLAAKIQNLKEIDGLQNSKDKRKKRGEIRKAWHSKIDSLLTPEQIKVRHIFLGL